MAAKHSLLTNNFLYYFINTKETDGSPEEKREWSLICQNVNTALLSARRGWELHA